MPRPLRTLTMIAAVLTVSCGATAVSTTDTPATLPATSSTTTVTTTTAPVTTTTSTLPPEPVVGWTAWLPAEPGDGPPPSCSGCAGGETPVSRDLWTAILFVESDGTVWATRDGGLILWHPVSGRVDLLGREDGLLDTLVYSISRAPDGLLWMATYGGANTWDGARLGDGLTRDLGLVDRTTWDLWIQSDGTVWVDTSRGYVLTAFDGTGFRHFSDAATAASLGHGIEAVFPERTQFNPAMAETPDGTAWFGTNGNGLFSFDGTDWRRYTEADGLPSDSVDRLAVTPDGTLWLSAIGGLVRFDGSTFEVVDPGDAGHWQLEYPDTLAVGPDGALWVMTTQSVFRHLDGAWEMWDRVDGLGIRMIYSLAVGEDGSVWISTADGVARYGTLPAGG